MKMCRHNKEKIKLTATSSSPSPSNWGIRVFDFNAPALMALSLASFINSLTLSGRDSNVRGSPENDEAENENSCPSSSSS